MECWNCPLEFVEVDNLCETYCKDMEEWIRKDDKYRWHDLRKNPYDLPKANVNIVLTDGETYFAGHTYRRACGVAVEMRLRQDYGYFDKTTECYVDCGDFIAWREIEPFEEEK